MTNEEIKKALVLCQCGAVITCRKCPYTENCNGAQLLQDALDLITEQEKDIKQLKTECALLDDELRIARQNTIDVLNELKERIPLAMSKQYVCVQIDEMIKEIEK